MICEVCKERPGVKYEYEYRTRHRRTLICFCDICVHRIVNQKIRAPAYIPDEQVVKYILAKEVKNEEVK